MYLTHKDTAQRNRSTRTAKKNKTNLCTAGKPSLQKLSENNIKKLMHTLSKLKPGKIRYLLKYNFRIVIMTKTTSYFSPLSSLQSLSTVDA